MLHLQIDAMKWHYTFKDGVFNDTHIDYDIFKCHSQLIVPKHFKTTYKYAICTRLGDLNESGEIQNEGSTYISKIFDVVSFKELIEVTTHNSSITISNEPLLQSQINNYHRENLVCALHVAYYNKRDKTPSDYDSFIAEMERFTCNHHKITKEDLESLYKCMDKFYDYNHEHPMNGWGRFPIKGEKTFIELIAHILSYLNPYSYLTDKPRSDLAAKRTFQEIVKTQSEQSVAIIL